MKGRLSLDRLTGRLRNDSTRSDPLGSAIENRFHADGLMPRTRLARERVGGDDNSPSKFRANSLQLPLLLLLPLQLHLGPIITTVARNYCRSRALHSRLAVPS